MNDCGAIAKWISNRMNFAVMAEAISWPSPGLVSSIDRGSHDDMDIYTFINSSIALSDYFKMAAENGIKHAFGSDLPSLFPILQRLGLEAEADMFDMTGGVNTHRGMIFHGLLLCAAAGVAYMRDKSFVPGQICGYIREFAADDIGRQLEHAGKLPYDKLTVGLKAYCRYGLKGIRGEAMDGYKSVFEAGLPALKEAMARGRELREAIIHTLLALMSKTEDTTLLNRHFDIVRIKYAREYAQKVLDCGSIFTTEGQLLLEQMCRDFKERSLSPGGAADLTCATLALHLWDSDHKRGGLYGFERDIV